MPNDQFLSPGCGASSKNSTVTDTQTFLINNVECQLTVGHDCISCTPTGTDDEEKKERKSKSVSFDTVIAIKRSPTTSTSFAYRQSTDTQVVKQHKLKLYYAKQICDRSGVQHLKLKKLKIKTLLKKRNISTKAQDPVIQVTKEGITTHATTCSKHNLTSEQSFQEEQRIALNQIAQKLEKALDDQKCTRPKQLLVFVNPHGGKGRAVHIYKLKVRQLFKLAGVEVKLIITNYANHARDTLEDPLFNVCQYHGIVCIGGDGMFAELMNGLLFRYNRDKILKAACEIQNVTLHGTPSSETLIQSEKSLINSDAMQDPWTLDRYKTMLGGIGQQFNTPPIPLGVIGAGSTDANSYGLIGSNDVVTGALNIILGNQINIDACSVHSYADDRLLRFVSTFIAYGYFGDIIRESEKLRWLGPSRYDVSGVSNLIKNRSYEATVNILISDKDGSPTDNGQCLLDCNCCRKLSTPSDELRFIKRVGPFVGVNAAVTACRCPQTKKGFSPSNHIANGCADLIIVNSCTRWQYIRYLMRTGWSKKSAFDLKYVSVYRCRQFEFVPHPKETPVLQFTHEQGSTASSSFSTYSKPSSVEQANTCDKQETWRDQEEANENLVSSWNADGEILDEQSIRVKVNNQLVRVFGMRSCQPAPGLISEEF